MLLSTFSLAWHRFREACTLLHPSPSAHPMVQSGERNWFLCLCVASHDYTVHVDVTINVRIEGTSSRRCLQWEPFPNWNAELKERAQFWRARDTSKRQCNVHINTYKIHKLSLVLSCSFVIDATFVVAVIVVRIPVSYSSQWWDFLKSQRFHMVQFVVVSVRCSIWDNFFSIPSLLALLMLVNLFSPS